MGEGWGLRKNRRNVEGGACRGRIQDFLGRRKKKRTGQLKL